MEKWTEKAFSDEKMAKSMMVSIQMTSKMDEECLCGRMEGDMKERGKTENNMAKGL